MHTVVLGFSGGLDSTVLLYYLLNQGKRVIPVLFQYGSKHEAKESEAAARICTGLNLHLTRVNLDFVGQMYQSHLLANGSQVVNGTATDPSCRKMVVPGRNSLFLSILAGIAESRGASQIAIGCNQDDHYSFSDTRPEFLNAAHSLFALSSEGKVDFIYPFSELTKTQIVQLGVELQVPMEQTWSCYAGGSAPCQVCPACRGRQQALSCLDLPFNVTAN